MIYIYNVRNNLKDGFAVDGRIVRGKMRTRNVFTRIIRPLPGCFRFSGAVILVSLLLSACSSSGVSKKPSQSISNYYRHKTITLIAPAPAGTDFDLYARAYAPEVGKLLDATVNVVNIPADGTVAGTDTLAAAAPNGLTLGMVNVGANIDNVLIHAPGMHYTVDGFRYLLQPGTAPMVFLAANNAPVKTFAGLLNYHKAISVGTSLSGTGYVFTAVLLETFHILHKFLTGVSNIVQQKQDFIAGDYMYTGNDLTFLNSVVTSHEGIPLVVDGVTNPTLKNTVKGVPTVEQIISKYGQHLSNKARVALEEMQRILSMGFEFAAPKGLPARNTEYLRGIFAKAARSSAVQHTLTKELESTSYVVGNSAQKLVAKAFANRDLISAFTKV